MPASSHSRVPRAHLDPIFTAREAMAVFRLAISQPLCAETLVMFLDGQQCGSSLVTVTDTDDPSHIIDIADAMAMAAASSPDIAGIVLATVRPGGGLLAGDDELWLAASDAVEDCGLVLIDWLIIGAHGTVSPRQELGMPSRWSCGQ